MADAPKRKVTPARPSAEDVREQEIREQEVLRANKELAAYFKGRRTEREAKAALKIIKAFVRDRERLEPRVRRPLPGSGEPPPRPKRRSARKKTKRVPVPHSASSGTAAKIASRHDATGDRGGVAPDGGANGGSAD